MRCAFAFSARTSPFWLTSMRSVVGASVCALGPPAARIWGVLFSAPLVLAVGRWWWASVPFFLLAVLVAAALLVIYLVGTTLWARAGLPRDLF